MLSANIPDVILSYVSCYFIYIWTFVSLRKQHIEIKQLSQAILKWFHSASMTITCAVQRCFLKYFLYMLHVAALKLLNCTELHVHSCRIMHSYNQYTGFHTKMVSSILIMSDIC